MFEYVIETMDCSFEWMVPIDIEPGKYVIEQSPRPQATKLQRMNPKTMMCTSK